MNTKPNHLLCAVAICLSVMQTQAHAEETAPADTVEIPQANAVEAAPADAEDASRTTATLPQAQPFPGSKISFAPLPVEVFMQPGQKPAVVFTTPCIQIAKMTNNFPPILAFENFMLEMIGKVNDSDVLPVRLEPVCV